MLINQGCKVGVVLNRGDAKNTVDTYSELDTESRRMESLRCAVETLLRCGIHVVACVGTC